jgi:predicted ATPase
MPAARRLPLTRRPRSTARLQGVAEPNTVVIADSTRRLVGNLFELEDFGSQELKGISGPVRAWNVLRPSSVESRFDAFHASGLTELVGREEELDLLLRRWSKAKSGEGQVVLLSGEPGIGKSRLTAALMERIADVPQALDRLIAAGLLFRQGLPPYASYLFKHALVQDAAYGTLLREPRRALHARIAETLERDFSDIAENQPEILALHCTEAGLIEKAAGLWGKAGQRSLERSALVEAAEHLTRALNQTATLPSTPALRKEQIRLQVALIHPLFHIRGFAAPETKAAAEQARLLIEKAEALGELLEDPLLLFSVLFGFWVANYLAFNGDVMRDLATQFLTLAKRQETKIPQMMGHQVMGISLAATGDLVHSLTHFDRGVAFYDPEQHRPYATRFGADIRVTSVSFRSWAQWMRGYPEAALADAKQALQEARDISQASTLLFALFWTSLIQVFCGNFTTATKEHDELIALADEKGSIHWKAYCTSLQGCLFALTGKASDAVQTISAGIAACRSTGASMFTPSSLSYLAKACAEVGQFEEALRCIGEAMSKAETTKESWFEAETNRIAGEIALMLPEPDVTKAQEYFESGIVIARQQQAKSWELRAATSLARLWRDQGKVQQARELLAPVYGWFTEGFDTRNLKEAKALLSTLS